MRRTIRSAKSTCRRLVALVADRRGATAVEYGLIAAVIVIAMMASFIEVAAVTKGIWNNISTKVQNAR